MLGRTLAQIGTCATRPAMVSRVVAVAAIAFVASGCGYHFAAEGSGLPPQAKTIYVEKFGNRTRQTGINDEFMRYVEDEIANHKRLELVDNPSDADLLLSGDIVFADSLPTAFNSANEPLTYTQTISADASLIDAHDHKVIWASRGLSSSAQMRSGGRSGGGDHLAVFRAAEPALAGYRNHAGYPGRTNAGRVLDAAGDAVAGAEHLRLDERGLLAVR